MPHSLITSPNAPAPIGPYSQAVLAGDTLYISGQIALDLSGNYTAYDDIAAETHHVMHNLHAILQAADMAWSNVVKCSIFIKDMNDFGRINAVYGEYFREGHTPARETVEVACLPRNARVEISCIAVKF